MMAAEDRWDGGGTLAETADACDSACLFRVERGDECVARCLAVRATGHTDPRWDEAGFIGHFEAADDPEAVGELLATACAWLRDTGVDRIVGPLNGDTWHRYRWNVGPHEASPFLLEPVNPEFYPRLWRDCGFLPLQTYVSQRIEDIPAVLGALGRVEEAIRDRGFCFRPFRLEEVDRELRRMYELSSVIFRDNFLYRPITWERFRALYVGVERLIEPGLVWFCEDRSGTPVGFVFSYPDSSPGVVNVKSLGRLPGRATAGLGGALMAQSLRGAVAAGRRRANMCLIRAGNQSGNLDRGHAQVFRSYVLYEVGP